MVLKPGKPLSSPFLLRDPTLSDVHIAFSYGGNLWIANHEGGNLRRLTSGGREGKPAFSPDGGHIAFIGEYDGTRSIYVIPTAGGEPRRLTHHSADLGIQAFRTGDAVGWTPDGTRVLFSSHRSAFAGGQLPIVGLLTVSLEGGFAEPLPFIRAAEGTFSPDATRFAFVPHVQYQPECKRYRGGQARFIWIAQMSDSSIEMTIPRDRSNDFNPMWVGDLVYFLSDRDGPTTIFAFDCGSKRVTRIVSNEGLDIKSAAASSGHIAYEKFGALHLLDLRSGEDRILDIRPAADFPEVRSRIVNVAEIVATDELADSIKPRLSPNGARAVFAARGRILSVPAERGDIRVLTLESGVVARDPTWSPDGTCIAYFSDASGEYALHIQDSSGLESSRRIHLGSPATFYYSPTWSPDSRNIAYTDKRLNYWYVALGKGTPVRIDTDLFTDPGRGFHDLQLTWSPDSRWIAYTRQLLNHLHAAFVYSIDHAMSYQLTDGMSDVRYLAFDKGGKYLYCTASTDAAMATDWLDMNRIHRPVTRGVYAMVLNKDDSTPLPFQSDEEHTPTATRDSYQSATTERAESVKIDIEGIDKRIVRLPIPARNYWGLFSGKQDSLFVVEGPITDERFSDGGYQPQKVYWLDLCTRKTERVLENVVYFDLSFSGERMLYAKQQRTCKKWFITDSQKSAVEACEATEDLFTGKPAGISINPRAEWAHMFEQVWRNERDFFYDPGLHGMNLEELKRLYKPFLQNIVTREELDYLFCEMLSNMTVLHLDAVRPEALKPKSVTLGLLGADYIVEQGRYRISRVFDSDPWSDVSRAPLRQPGMTVHAGEYLLGVNGRDIFASADVYSHFTETAGKQIVLKVGPSADGSGSRDVVVVPVAHEYELRYFDWIQHNRRRVEALTDGRVAYLHLPNCQVSGYTAFNRYFFAQAGKDALIIDDRYNNGGSGPDYILSCLSRQVRCYWHMREGRDITTPLLGIFGPKVMLINEASASMGECLPWTFRKAGIGPLIGTRTWGGLVGHYTYPRDLLDGGIVCAPNLAGYSGGGAWEVENEGIEPDIEVEDDPKAGRIGDDKQLERAVEVVLDLLKRHPPRTTPKHPPFPIYRHEN